MDKKAIFFALLISVALMSAMVMGQEDTDNTALADMNEAAIMHNGIGAQVRLLQLEKSITRNYLYGDNVIAYIKNNSLNVSTDTLDLMEGIVLDLVDVRTQVSAEINKSANETTVETFVALKDRAINLTQEFRSLVMEQLSPDQRKSIRESIDKKDFKEVTDIADEIKGKVREFNKDRAIAMLDYMNITDDALLQRIESGNITAQELRKTVMDRFRQESQDRKRAFLSGLKEERKQAELYMHMAFAKKLGLNMSDFGRVRGIVQDDNLTSSEMKARLGAFVKEKIQERNDTMHQIRDRLKEVVQERKGMMNQTRENMKQRLEDRRGGNR
jgi:hypothetical protein